MTVRNNRPMNRLLVLIVDDIDDVPSDLVIDPWSLLRLFRLTNCGRLTGAAETMRATIHEMMVFKALTL